MTKSRAPELPPEVREAVLAALGGEPTGDEFAWMSWAGTTWRLAAGDRAVFVKRARHLEDERARLLWLAGRWPVPELLGHFHAWGDEWLLTRAVAGRPLHDRSLGWPADHVARVFGEILHGLHATDARGCPFGVRRPGHVLVHGDFCLPNVLVTDGRLTGLVDVGGAGLGNPETDLAAGLWTLQYNFGRGFGDVFLEAYGWPPMSDEAMERLRRRYSTRSR